MSACARALAQIVQPVAQFLAAFPANLLFPLAVSLIVFWKLNPDIWLSPLMVLGTQWYILFNVIAGATAIPRRLRDAADNFRRRRLAVVAARSRCPRCFRIYVTGAITASGGSWNATIVAEVASWGDTHAARPWPGRLYRRRHGGGRFPPQSCWASAVMSFFVVVVNRIFWRPLYCYAERKFRLT